MSYHSEKKWKRVRWIRTDTTVDWEIQYNIITGVIYWWYGSSVWVANTRLESHMFYSFIRWKCWEMLCCNWCACLLWCICMQCACANASRNWTY